MRILFFVACVALLTVSHPVIGQEGPRIPWETCPCDGELGSVASVYLPEGFLFVGKDGVGKFMEASQNPPTGRELGVISKADDTSWFVLFSFDSVGYVRDDEKDDLDADALLQGLREGTEQSNEARREKGWAPVQIKGWNRQPFYDATTNNLTWAINGYSADGGDSVNYSVRLLGRSGVMDADLVADPSELSGAVVDFDQLLEGYAFNAGGRYAEFRSGDKIASYGLTALIAGGVGAAAVKSGLLAKFWKFIVFGFIALAGGIKKIWSVVTGRHQDAYPAQT